MFVSDDRHDFLSHLRSRDEAYGLDPELEYEKLETGEAFSGNELMELGFYDLVVHQDYTSKMYRFKGI